jgi:hypothetical protein
LIFQFTTRMESGGQSTQRELAKLAVSISCIEVAASLHVGSYSGRPNYKLRLTAAAHGKPIVTRSLDF